MQTGSSLRSLTLVLLVLAVFVGMPAATAAAWESSLHGGIDSCGVCHQDEHTDWPPTNENCLTCHSDFDVPDRSLTCWTCHLPGQDMSAARTDAACTATCHLADGTSVTHLAHADRPAACTTCHPVSATISVASGSPHHTFVPPTPVVTGFLPASAEVGTSVTVAGAGFVRVLAVRFNDVAAPWFRVDDETRITAVVPVGATSGPISVTTVGGVATSAASLSVAPAFATPTVASFFPLSGVTGVAVTVTGAGFTGATAVTVGGVAATFAVVSDTQVTATVPAGAVSGPIVVTGPGGAGSSATTFTVLTVQTSGLSLKVAPSVIGLGRVVKATGVLTPISLAGASVKVSVQRKKAGVWKTVTSKVVATKSTGAYAWSYRPGRTGSYRARTSIGATLTRTAARTSWVRFSVK